MIGFTVKIPGEGALGERIQRMAAEVQREQLPAMAESVRLVKERAEALSPSGPGHFGGRHLRDSWKTSVTPGLLATLGSISNDLPQAIWLSGGTQPHPIPPRRGRALAIGDRYVARVRNHPGVRATHLKQRVIEEAWPSVVEQFAGVRTKALRVF